MESFVSLINKTYGNQIRVRMSSLLISDNKLLLLKQNANNSIGHLWLAPGGGLNFGECMLDCLKRETLEETGLVVEENYFYGITEYIQAPLHAIEIFYVCNIVSGELKLGIDPEFDDKNQIIQEFNWFSFEEIQALQAEEKHLILHDVEKLQKLLVSA